MSTRKAATPPTDRPGQNKQEAAPLKPALKLLISGLLIFHLTAVFWAPFAFACNVGGSTSPLADPIGRWLHPYMAALYLDHGYFFFAPNPGPSHLVRYKVEFADGRQPVVGTFPDLKTQQPRLLYHRHFMLAEALHNRFTPPDAPPEPTPPPLTASAIDKARFRSQREAYTRELAAWRHQRRQYEALWQAFEQHLLSGHGGSMVTLTRVEHRLPAPYEVTLGGRKLDAADSFVELPESAPPEARR